jgi:hypothetical protein
MRLPRQITTESGACAGGCVVLIAALVLVIGALLWGAVSTYEGAYQMTSSAPRDLGPPPTPAEVSSFQSKLALVRQGLQETGTKEYAFSAGDLNAWLWADGANADLVKHLRLRIEQDWLVGELSVPLTFMRDVPFLPGISQRFFDGRMAARWAVENRELTIKSLDLEGNGRRLAWLFTGQSYRETIANGIKREIRARLPAGDLVLDRLEGFRIAGDQVYLTLRGGQP